jgi:hypothetical protein
MPLSVREYFEHILIETSYILTSSADLDKATFVQDETLKRHMSVVLRSLAKPSNRSPTHSAKNTRRSNGVLSVACAIG